MYSIRNLNCYYLNILILLIVSFFSFSCSLANDDKTQHKLNDISSQCKNSLGWYDDHPGYIGEFNRILEYCKQ